MKKKKKKKIVKTLIRKKFIRRNKNAQNVLYTFKLQLCHDLHNS